MTSPDEPDLPGDEQLVRDCLAGRDELFSELVSRHRSRIFGLASRFARHHQELDDLCQEIFIRVYRNLQSFRGEAPFQHWLSRIATRTCYDHLRKRSREPAGYSLDATPLPLVDPGSDHRNSIELADQLHWALQQLDARDQIIITLLELEERTIQEISEITGWSLSNVKVRAFRARQQLKTILKTDEHTSSSV